MSTSTLDLNASNPNPFPRSPPPLSSRISFVLHLLADTFVVLGTIPLLLYFVVALTGVLPAREYEAVESIPRWVWMVVPPVLGWLALRSGREGVKGWRELGRWWRERSRLREKEGRDGKSAGGEEDKEWMEEKKVDKGEEKV